MLVGCCRPCLHVPLSSARADGARCAEWLWAACRHACLDYTPRETLRLKAGQYKYTGTTPLNIPSSPDPFPLGPHTLPLGLLDVPAHKRDRRVDSREGYHVQHTLTHASLINESSAALTNFHIPAALCIGPTCEAGLSTDA